MQHFDLSFIEDALSWCILTVGITGQPELHGHTSADECNHGELFESDAVFDDALLDAQSLPLDRSKQLFDMPSQPIPTDHLQGLRNTLHPVGRQQTPADRLLAGRRIAFASFASKQLDPLWRLRIRAPTPPTAANGSERHHDPGLS